MGSGISLLTSCCNKDNKNQDLIDIDINRIHNNNNLPNINYLKSPTKITQKENYFENIIKTDIKKNKFKKNDFLTFKKRNYTQKHFNRNNLIHINTLKTLKNSRYISLAPMHILRNNTNNKFYSSYFNTLSGKLGKNSSSYYFSSGVKDKFNENFKNINTKLKLTGELFSNKKLIIYKCSLKQSMKKESNGIISFGISYTNNSIYDYILDKNIAEKIDKNKKYNNNKLFDIFLDQNEKVYMLYFMHNSLLLYYKINEKLNLDFDRDYYFIIGKIFMSIKIKNSKKLKINIEFKPENDKTKKYIFELKDLPIKIGKKDCTINIPSISGSKLQSQIVYDNGSFWYKEENSKNGETLVLKEDDYLKIKGKMNFKLEDIPFTIEETNNKIIIKEENTNMNNTNVDNKEDEEEEDDD